MILAMRTDNPRAELYLFENDQQKAGAVWQAHRELSATIHNKIEQLCGDACIKLKDVTGIAFYSGPGSFTGLRIGISVANALGASYDIPVTAVNGDDWINDGLRVLAGLKGFEPIEPVYGSEAVTTLPKK